ncbi:hypothetical protein GCM10010313_73560 [Streptomyces violarus]|uniref:Uncharacterized protein n=1 Tax=Streptomyces violarus TaxID=67380 RepID=A0A7W5F5E3_9ACTN|nr:MULTISPECIES: hypothetical protein [Streptomyces]MBB3080434.1 hypothetical protein [Streptomyces violarus]WRT98275.1 hypothetical protein VJ737_11535 [Streptomyces sp. CGMCC 4.1772]GHD30681.1 hypothetical protein GCM10010313_73560 [Streptomyces violarus]
MFHFVVGLLDGSPVVAVLALTVLTGPVLLRQVFLFLGFRWALRGVRHDTSRVSLFTTYSAALTARRARGVRRSGGRRGGPGTRSR